MQKAYLLLRNNQQTGPHSFEELLQLKLKPNDLIWVEGKSYAWRYPTEVETLKNYFIKPVDAFKEEKRDPASDPVKVSAGQKVLPKRIFVSMPFSEPIVAAGKVVDTIEEKAEELCQRAQAYIPKEEPVKTNLTRNLYEAEEDYTQWIFQKKTKKTYRVSKRFSVFAAISIGLLTGGWWLYDIFSNSPDTVFSTTALTAPKEENLENTKTEVPAISIDVPVSEKQFSSTAKINKKTVQKKEVVTNNSITGSLIVSEPGDKKEIKKETNEEIIEAPVAGDQNEEETTEMPAATKKTVKERFNELFKNKKTTETGSRGTENKNNERKATRRGEETETTAAVTDISKEVEIKTNKLADSWMMGVKNLKITLFNRSELTLIGAKVEIQYFSDNEELLETITLSFSNIAPKKSQTLAVPDHRLADHIEYKVLSATGIEKAVARR